MNAISKMAKVLMSITDFNGFQALALAMLDDLHVRCMTRNAVLNIGHSSQVCSSSRAIGSPKDLWKQGCITGIPIREQSNPMRVTQAVGSILE
jgi:hypothetical protein